MKFNFFKKKTNVSGSPKEQATESAEQVTTIPKPEKNNNRFSLRNAAITMTPLTLAAIVFGTVLSVFVVHSIVSAWKAHKEYEARYNAFHPNGPVIHKRFNKLPGIVDSEEKVYLALAKLSELAPIQFTGEQIKSNTFKKLAQKVTVAHDLYVAKIKAVISAPISTDLFLLPFIQQDLQKNHAVLTQVLYTKGGGHGNNSMPRMILYADVYGSSPQSRNPAEEGVARENGFNNYVKKF